MWMMPLHLHVIQKSDYDDDDEKGTARALEKIYLQMISLDPLVKNQNNFTEMVLMLPSSKIDQVVQLD